VIVFSKQFLDFVWHFCFYCRDCLECEMLLLNGCREKLALFTELADIFNDSDNQKLWRELLNRVGWIKLVVNPSYNWLIFENNVIISLWEPLVTVLLAAVMQKEDCWTDCSVAFVWQEGTAKFADLDAVNTLRNRSKLSGLRTLRRISHIDLVISFMFIFVYLTLLVYNNGSWDLIVFYCCYYYYYYYY